MQQWEAECGSNACDCSCCSVQAESGLQHAPPSQVGCHEEALHGQASSKAVPFSSSIHASSCNPQQGWPDLCCIVAKVHAQCCILSAEMQPTLGAVAKEAHKVHDSEVQQCQRYSRREDCLGPVHSPGIRRLCCKPLQRVHRHLGAVV